jgi:hypothetical protein
MLGLRQLQSVHHGLCLIFQGSRLGYKVLLGSQVTRESNESIPVLLLLYTCGYVYLSVQVPVNLTVLSMILGIPTTFM